LEKDHFAGCVFKAGEPLAYDLLAKEITDLRAQLAEQKQLANVALGDLQSAQAELAQTKLYAGTLEEWLDSKGLTGAQTQYAARLARGEGKPVAARAKEGKS
jgi:hypothetical protein